MLLLVIPIFVIGCVANANSAGSYGLPRLERSYWVHMSLGTNLIKGYWAENAPNTRALPTAKEIRNAAALLTSHYGANRLYLVYHNEVPIPTMARILKEWQLACHGKAEVIPTLVLRRFDKLDAAVFSEWEFNELLATLKNMGFRRVGVYDVLPGRDLKQWVLELGRTFREVIRVGIQPEEEIVDPFAGAVQDTWSGLCSGKTNDDWQSRGFGKDTLLTWVKARSTEGKRVAWNLVAVAWDYSATLRGEYPGYDDAAKNMPLPCGRNFLAARQIVINSNKKTLAGFSSDLVIVEFNSRHKNRDGHANSMYTRLRRGEVYSGYFSEPLEEIAAIYRCLRAGSLLKCQRAPCPEAVPTQD